MNPPPSTLKPLLWGILHGLNDLVAGYMLANYALHHQSADSTMMLVIYAILGFGGQLPVGILLDRSRQIKHFAWISIILLIISTALYSFDPFTAIIITGFAGAGIHVTGGAICLQVSKSSGALGVFTAPGVLGLTLGGLAGAFAPGYLMLILLFLLIISGLIFRNGIPVYQVYSNKNEGLDTHDLIMMGILLIMCFRSFIFDVMNAAALHFENGILVFGISAFLGKIIGGVLADRIGWKKFIYITLSLSFILFTFGKENIYAVASGIACLQSSVPMTLMLMSRSMPLFPATATALSLGTSVALAGLPLYLGPSNHTSSWLWILLFIAMAAGWWLISRMLKRRMATG